MNQLELEAFKSGYVNLYDNGTEYRCLKSDGAEIWMADVKDEEKEPFIITEDCFLGYPPHILVSFPR